MLRSLFSAVSSLRNHQSALDVIAHNLANVNTVGFKSGRANFQETLSQTISGPRAPAPAAGGGAAQGLGGVNPSQIGLGMRLASIDTLQIQGSFQNTGRTTDLAIQGNGMFVLSDQTPVPGGGGAPSARITYTRDGSFDVDATGRLVNPSNGMVVQGYAIPAGQQTANPAPGTPLVPIVIPPGTYSSFAISPNGVVTGYSANGTATPIAQIAIANFPNPSGLQRVGSNMFEWTPAAGLLAGAPAAPTSQDVANNVSGIASTGGRGEIMPGTLEMSNVDIAGQMSAMIVTQRGFQVNSRAVTTGDEMLQELLNLKR
ncbi:MAG: flagellar basal body protein [Dehalococcoidia bacterium]|nr:MAG: flagellar basal body protein [Dehalococcoidia bacterium]